MPLAARLFPGFHLSNLERLIRDGLSVYPRYGEWHWAMHKTFTDESGVNDPLAFAMACYFGRDAQLDRLAKRWEAVLRKPEYDMAECGFHAKEFYKPSPNDKVYNWPTAKRDRFIKELISAIEDCRIWLFATGVDAEAFYALSEGERRHLTGGVFNGPSGKWKLLSGKASAPYFLALRVQLETIAMRTPSGQKCFQILHRQNEYEGYAHDYYDWITGDRSPIRDEYDTSRLGHPLVFASHTQYLQLQAADLA